MIARNTFWTNDNLYILHGLNSESVDMIYLDPPFNSKRMYSAPVGSQARGASFKDMWSWQDVNEHYLESLAEGYPHLLGFIKYSVLGFHGKDMAAYLTYIAQRLVEMKRVLKSTGSIYLHCDPSASHYLKLLMDSIFGYRNFVNEVIWHYDGPQSPSHYKLSTKHDVILRYAKRADCVFTNSSNLYQSKVVDSDQLKRYRKDENDKWYYDTPRGRYTDESIKRLDKEGRIRITSSGKVRIKHFLLQHANGSVVRRKKLSDVWNDILSLGLSNSKEKTGYPTQKPLALLERIILLSSNKGDVVLDPFCGCATTCVASQRLDRRWLGIDVAEKSAQLVIDRLSDDGTFKDFVHRKDIPKRTDVQAMEETPNTKEKLFIQQEGTCNGCKVKFSQVHFEIDHIVPKAKGGGNYYENYQLLCGHCNKVKGDTPMEYIWMKATQRDKLMQ